MKNTPLNRRQVVQTLAVVGAGLALGSPARAETKPLEAVKIVALSSLKKDFDTAEFTFDGDAALLVRLPTLPNDKRRALEVKDNPGKDPTVKDVPAKDPAVKDVPAKDLAVKDPLVKEDDTKFYLVAYTRVCTHLGCKPNLPNVTEHKMICPCHGSTFAADGSVVKGPAKRSLESIVIEVRGKDVYAVARAAAAQ